MPATVNATATVPACIPHWYAQRITTQIALRLPEELVERIDRQVPPGGSRSEIVRRAIEAYLYRLACEQDAAAYEQLPLTDAELALADDPSGWEPTPNW